MSLLIKKILQKIKDFEERTKDSGWINLELLTGWQEHSSGAQNPPQYEKKNGIVFLHGCAMTSTGTSSSNRNIAQLPEGFRPSGTVNNLYYTVRISSGAESIIGHVQITKTGIIMAPSNLKAYDWLALEGISFPVE